MRPNCQGRKLKAEQLEHRRVMAADPGWALALNTQANEMDPAVGIAPDGSVYLTGTFSGTVDFDPGAATFNLTSGSFGDGFVAKYSPKGSLIWATKFGGATLDYSNSIAFDAAGDAYIAGHSSTAMQFGTLNIPNNGSYDVFVSKLDGATGAFEWARGLGGSQQDTAYDIRVTSAGDVFVSGTFRGSADFDPGAGVHYRTETGGSGAGDAFVWKLDSSGAFQWVRQFGNEHLENGHRLALGNNGEIYAAGTFRGSADFGDPGNPLLLTSPNTTTADLFLVKLDQATGASAWARQATGTQHINAAWVATDDDGGVYFAGGFAGSIDFGPGTPALTSAGGSDVFLSKWDDQGNIVWAESLATGSGDTSLRSVYADTAGRILLGIEFQGTADFDPSAATVNLTSAGAADGAILELNGDGSFARVRHVANGGNSRAEHVVADAVGNVYVAGIFQSSVSLPTGHELTSSGHANYLMKLADADPATKFYVVNDASANATYEYDAAGATNGNSGLASANSAPRGAASTAAGDRVWVIDANRKVYVYDINGNLLGSWSAGTMPSNATPEGIATNGVDVWIVDGKSDKVYRYASAASRLSGSQNASSSFNLNSGNRNPKDIVTDGSSLWVVNDASTDKVFKYSTSGALQGSWTTTGGGSQPTGITIDPTTVSDIWIADNGTDRVYRYAAAAARTSGSQAASDFFALAAGNTNPQGIADPPPLVGSSTDVAVDRNVNATVLPPLNETSVASKPARPRSSARQALPRPEFTRASRQDHTIDRSTDRRHDDITAFTTSDHSSLFDLKDESWAETVDSLFATFRNRMDANESCPAVPWS